MTDRCRHSTCVPKDAVWLPQHGETSHEEATPEKLRKHGKLAPHRYCKACGLVKEEGDGKGRREGYYFTLLNLLKAYLERSGRKLTKVDIRLICREIRGNELFTDTYGSRREAQERAFVEIILGRRGDIDRAKVSEFVLGHGVTTMRRRPRST